VIRIGFLMCVAGIMFPYSCTLAFCEEIQPTENCAMKVFSVQHKGQVLDVKHGEYFLVILSNPGAGGYMVQNPEFDSQILTLQKMEKKPPSDPCREGDFGSFEWTFRAKKEGISTIIVRASRPWERGKAPATIFEASVRVRQ